MNSLPSEHTSQSGFGTKYESFQKAQIWNPNAAQSRIYKIPNSSKNNNTNKHEKSVINIDLHSKLNRSPTIKTKHKQSRITFIKPLPLVKERPTIKNSSNKKKYFNYKKFLSETNNFRKNVIPSTSIFQKQKNNDRKEEEKEAVEHFVPTAVQHCDFNGDLKSLSVIRDNYGLTQEEGKEDSFVEGEHKHESCSETNDNDLCSSVESKNDKDGSCRGETVSNSPYRPKQLNRSKTYSDKNMCSFFALISMPTIMPRSKTIPEITTKFNNDNVCVDVKKRMPITVSNHILEKDDDVTMMSHIEQNNHINMSFSLKKNTKIDDDDYDYESDKNPKQNSFFLKSRIKKLTENCSGSADSIILESDNDEFDDSSESSTDSCSPIQIFSNPIQPLNFAPTARKLIDKLKTVNGHKWVETNCGRKGKVVMEAHDELETIVLLEYKNGEKEFRNRSSVKNITDLIDIIQIESDSPFFLSKELNLTEEEELIAKLRLEMEQDNFDINIDCSTASSSTSSSFTTTSSSLTSYTFCKIIPRSSSSQFTTTTDTSTTSFYNYDNKNKINSKLNMDEDDGAKNRKIVDQFFSTYKYPQEKSIIDQIKILGPSDLKFMVDSSSESAPRPPQPKKFIEWKIQKSNEKKLKQKSFDAEKKRKSEKQKENIRNKLLHYIPQKIQEGMKKLSEIKNSKINTKQIDDSEDYGGKRIEDSDDYGGSNIPYFE